MLPLNLDTPLFSLSKFPSRNSLVVMCSSLSESSEHPVTINALRNNRIIIFFIFLPPTFYLYSPSSPGLITIHLDYFLSW
ncbi:hypothetical protein IV70_GL001742 [Carnobacterium maltaromaticum DSM 20342]|nr:hypothetical protein IV70_GL001742 [Carnobacterium maltaromaticum DSM 20342]